MPVDAGTEWSLQTHPITSLPVYLPTSKAVATNVVQQYENGGQPVPYQSAQDAAGRLTFELMQKLLSGQVDQKTLDAAAKWQPKVSKATAQQGGQHATSAKSRRTSISQPQDLVEEPADGKDEKQLPFSLRIHARVLQQVTARFQTAMSHTFSEDFTNWHVQSALKKIADEIEARTDRYQRRWDEDTGTVRELDDAPSAEQLEFEKMRTRFLSMLDARKKPIWRLRQSRAAADKFATQCAAAIIIQRFFRHRRHLRRMREEEQEQERRLREMKPAQRYWMAAAVKVAPGVAGMTMWDRLLAAGPKGPAWRASTVLPTVHIAHIGGENLEDNQHLHAPGGHLHNAVRHRYASSLGDADIDALAIAVAMKLTGSGDFAADDIMAAIAEEFIAAEKETRAAIARQEYEAAVLRGEASPRPYGEDRSKPSSPQAAPSSEPIEATTSRAKASPTGTPRGGKRGGEAGGGAWASPSAKAGAGGTLPRTVSGDVAAATASHRSSSGTVGALPFSNRSHHHGSGGGGSSGGFAVGSPPSLTPDVRGPRVMSIQLFAEDGALGGGGRGSWAAGQQRRSQWLSTQADVAAVAEVVSNQIEPGSETVVGALRLAGLQASVHLRQLAPPLTSASADGGGGGATAEASRPATVDMARARPLASPSYDGETLPELALAGMPRTTRQRRSSLVMGFGGAFAEPVVLEGRRNRRCSLAMLTNGSGGSAAAAAVDTAAPSPSRSRHSSVALVNQLSEAASGRIPHPVNPAGPASPLVSPQSPVSPAATATAAATGPQRTLSALSSQGGSSDMNDLLLAMRDVVVAEGSGDGAAARRPKTPLARQQLCIAESSATPPNDRDASGLHNAAQQDSKPLVSARSPAAMGGAAASAAADDTEAAATASPSTDQPFFWPQPPPSPPAAAASHHHADSVGTLASPRTGLQLQARRTSLHLPAHDTPPTSPGPSWDPCGPLPMIVKSPSLPCNAALPHAGGGGGGGGGGGEFSQMGRRDRGSAAVPHRPDSGSHPAGSHHHQGTHPPQDVTSLLLSKLSASHLFEQRSEPCGGGSGGGRASPLTVPGGTGTAGGTSPGGTSHHHHHLHQQPPLSQQHHTADHLSPTSGSTGSHGGSSPKSSTLMSIAARLAGSPAARLSMPGALPGSAGGDATTSPTSDLSVIPRGASVSGPPSPLLLLSRKRLVASEGADEHHTAAGSSSGGGGGSIYNPGHAGPTMATLGYSGGGNSGGAASSAVATVRSGLGRLGVVSAGGVTSDHMLSPPAGCSSAYRTMSASPLVPTPPPSASSVAGVGVQLSAASCGRLPRCSSPSAGIRYNASTTAAATPTSRSVGDLSVERSRSPFSTRRSGGMIADASTHRSLSNISDVVGATGAAATGDLQGHGGSSGRPASGPMSMTSSLRPRPAALLVGHGPALLRG